MDEQDWEAVRAACRENGWPTPEQVAETGSTNADLRVREGDGLVLVAERQTAGRGRLDRHWVSAPGDGLTFSVRRRMPATAANPGWIPLLFGVAAAEAAARTTGRAVELKWPNDLRVPAGKVGGILSEVAGDGVVVGIGLNLQFAGELPDPEAAALYLPDETPQPGLLLAELLRVSGHLWQAWVEAGGDARRSGLAERYEKLCGLLGGPVRVGAADGEWTGIAERVDDSGALVVRSDGRVRSVLAGDITRLREY